MENTIELISIILNFLLASGLAGTFVFYKSKMRKANAEAEAAEIDNEGTEIARLEKRLEGRDDKIDELNAKVHSLYKIIGEKDQVILSQEKHKTILEFAICNKFKCQERDPPFLSNTEFLFKELGQIGLINEKEN